MRDKIDAKVGAMVDEKKTIKFQMMMSPAEAEAIDDWGFSKRIKSRAEAIRQLVMKGMLYDGLNEAYDVAVTMTTSYMKGETPPKEEIEKWIDKQVAHANHLEKDYELTVKRFLHDLTDKLIKDIPKLPRDKAREIARTTMMERISSERARRILSEMGEPKNLESSREDGDQA